MKLAAIRRAYAQQREQPDGPYHAGQVTLYCEHELKLPHDPRARRAFRRCAPARPS